MNNIYKEKYEKEGKRSFPIGFKSINAKQSSIDDLKKLPTSARSCINALDTKVPEGYTVEAVMAGLTLPTDLTFAPDGTLFVRQFMAYKTLYARTSNKTKTVR